MELYLNQLFIRILNMSITAGYCIAAVLIIRLLFRKAHRKYLYALWLVVAFRLLCPVSVSTEFSLFNLDNFSQSVSHEGTGSMEYIPEHIADAEQPEIHTGIRAADTLVNTGLPRASSLELHGVSLKNLLYVNGHYREPVVMALAVGKYVWAAGVLAFLLYFAVSMWRMRKKVQMAVLVNTREPEAVSARMPGHGRRKKAVRIYECDGLASPFTMGFLRPRIYLPCHLNGEMREMILLHEQYHICRKDHLVKLLAFILLAVYWFHPLVWAAWFGVCKDMEMSCDEKVLEILGEEKKKDYGLTLLAFASRRCPGSRMPLAFGEHDVESRIKHTLQFKKPALWAGILAVAALAAVLVIFGTNGLQKENPSEENETEGNGTEELSVQAGEEDSANAGVSGQAQLLYEARNPYVGDAPADGNVLKAIASARPDSVFAGLSYKVELQTSAEPYEFHFLLEENGESLEVDEEDAPALDVDMQITSVLMLALIDNLGEVQWYYTMTTPDGMVDDAVHYFDAEQAAEWCQVDNIKDYGTSPRKVQELLAILEEKETEIKAVGDDSGEFARWYSSLPYELYENAVPIEETEQSYTAYHDRGEDFMVILAESGNDIVKVYGCYSRQYGARGLTIDYRITPGGDSNHNYMDMAWDAENPCCQAAMADYDGDGREEIALTLLGGKGTGSHVERLIILETYDTGTVVPCEFTYDQIRQNIAETVTASVDTENNLVQILDNTAPESSVPVLSIPYESAPGIVNPVTSVDFTSWFQFHAGDTLTLQAEPGLLMKNWPGLRFLPQQDGTAAILTFQVSYKDAPSPEGTNYTLTLEN